MTRFSLNLGFLDRPLVVGFFIILLTGQIFPTMYVAAFFELLWIDLIPAGTFIPPNAIFCVAATMVVVEIYSLSDTSQIFPIMVMTIPVAILFSILEGKQRKAQNKNYNIILQQSRKTAARYNPQSMINSSLIQLLLIYLTVGTAAIYGLVFIYEHLSPYLVHRDYLSWPLLLLMASISALAALRIRKAYFSLVLGLTLVSGYLAWQIFLA
nr:PTS sugar transporter subunit IIC [Desulfonatronovibrio hydrogenovorans]